MRVGVVTFPGSLDDGDAARAVRLAGGEAVRLWHGDDSLRDVDAVVLPGGFSYGDYLRCGAIARFAPVMAPLVEAARGGLPVLGICNGFQVLCESHLLPGALIRNDHRKFNCVDQELEVVERVDGLDRRLLGRPACRRTAEERRGRLRRGRGDAGPARGRGPGRRAVRRRQPQRVVPVDRGDHQRARQRRRADAAPGARRRGADRAVDRRADLLHLGADRGGVGMSETVSETVKQAEATPETEQPYRELGLKDDEYARIREILGRRPTSSELAMYSVMWSEHCSYKSTQGAPAAVRRQGPEDRRAARRHRGERRRRRHRRRLGGDLQGRVAQPPELRRALPGRGHRGRRHRARHHVDGRPPGRGDGPAALRPGRRRGHPPGAARRRRGHRRLRQLPRACPTSAARSSSTRPTPATRSSTRCASA